MLQTGAGTALSARSSHPSDAPLLSGLLFSLRLVGTGLEGCWLAWRVSEIGLAQRKEDECFSLSEVTLGRGRNAVASPDGPTRTIFTTNALPLLDLGPGTWHTYLFRGACFHPQQGSKAVGREGSASFPYPERKGMERLGEGAFSIQEHVQSRSCASWASHIALASSST